MNTACVAEWRGSQAVVQMTRNDWPRPVSLSACEDRNRLLFILPPVVARGEGRFTARRGSTATAMGSTSFFPSHEAYESWGEGGPTVSLRCHFDSDRLAELIERPRIDWSLSALNRGLNLDGSPVHAVLARLAAEMRSPGLGSEAMIESLFTQALLELGRALALSPEEATGGRLAAAQMSRLRDRVEAIDLPLPSVSELAALCGIGERHLSRLFRRSTGQRLSDYLREVQQGKARHLLADTDLPLKEIAYRLGFSDHSSFATAFRRACGETPKAYRRRMRAPGIFFGHA